MTTPAASLAAAIASAVRERMSEHLRLLEILTAIPSHATVAGGTDRVAAEILPLLEAVGFTIGSVDQGPLPSDARWIEEIMIPGQRQEELGATYHAVREGEGDLRVLLLGDLDSAYPLEAHERFAPEMEGSRFYGPGVADMKGGLVVMVAALQGLHELGIRTPPIEIVLAGDEQAGSLGSRHVIEEVARRCAWTLCVECARRGGQLMAARGHIGIGDLTSRGVEAHAGSAFEDGVNAVEFLARVIPAVDALSRPDEGVLVSVTMLHAGRRRSIIPSLATGILDIRTPSEEVWNETIRQLDDVVARHGGGRVTARSYAHRPGVLWTAETDRLLELIRRVGSQIGVPISAFSSPAAGSSAFAGIAGSIVMDGMGPVGGGLMTPEEHIEVASIPERAAILAATTSQLGNSP